MAPACRGMIFLKKYNISNKNKCIFAGSKNTLLKLNLNKNR
jgi:hypothetical protein